MNVGGGGGRKLLIIIGIVLVVVAFLNRASISNMFHNITHKVLETFEEVKGKFETPVFEEEPIGGNKEVETEPEEEIEHEVSKEIIYVITESSVNIREDAGVDYKQIATAKKGDEFLGTGNEKEAGNGRPWYEIYLDEEKSKTGWVSSKVTKLK